MKIDAETLKKQVILHLPYVLFLLVFAKLGEAVRLAPGADASQKLLGLSEGFALAFQSMWPGAAMDWLIGFCGAAIMRLAVYLRGKDAKKYRKNVEYGSARWGNKADIAPFMDPNPENNIILTQSEGLMLNGRPKNPANARNKNVLVVGGSGSGKTRFFIKPNLMQMHSSYVVTDPKGTVLVECGKMLQRGTPKLDKDGKPVRNEKGKIIYESYKIRVFNTINFQKSMHFNPFAYIHSEKDILKIVTTLIANTKGEGKAGDDFWVKAETLLYTALIGYIYYEAPANEQNFATLVEMLNAMEVREDDESFKNAVDLLFDALEQKDPDHFALRQYKKYKLAAGVAQKYNCALKRLDYQQEQGLMSSLALGTNQIEIERGLTTSSTAIFVPFTTCELFQEGEALYYGLNALSNNLIMANRKTLKNPNGLFLGTPGSGKSFSAKREIVNVFLLTEDDIIIADPENEYGPLVQQFGSQGQVIDISPTSTNYINPMDINLDYSDDENPITLKSDFILSLCDLIIGGKEGLSPIERTIIDRCTRLVYREYLQDPCPENMPILGDLYELLLKQSEPEAQNIATALEIYVNGSLNVFNHRSNIQMDKHRVLCFQLKSLGKALKEIGLLIMQDAVWNRVTANRSKHKTTWFYIDEFHLLLKGQTGSFSVEIWKRFRKWGGIPSGLTQNVKDLLASREIENIFENSDFIYMLNQAQGDRQILAKQLGISPHQLSYVTHSGPGEGLLFFGNVIIPFVDHFPKDTLLYSVLTTRPDEVAGTKA